MMKISEHSHSAILAALREALCRYVSGEENSVVTDIHLLPKSGSGELVILDDDDTELAHIIVEEWIDYESDDFYNQVEPLLCNIVSVLKQDGLLDKLCLLKPYSFVLVDEEKETVADLLLVDDEDTLLLNGKLLEGLDEELNTFLKNLLEK